ILLLRMKRDNNSPFVQKSLKQVDKLHNLINDLLDVSKIEAGKLELNLQDFDINLLLKEMIENIQPTTPIRICFNPYNEMLMAYGDVDRIGRVIINLLGNAVKYAPAS